MILKVVIKKNKNFFYFKYTKQIQLGKLIMRTQVTNFCIKIEGY